MGLFFALWALFACAGYGLYKIYEILTTKPEKKDEDYTFTLVIQENTIPNRRLYCQLKFAPEFWRAFETNKTTPERQSIELNCFAAVKQLTKAMKGCE